MWTYEQKTGLMRRNGVVVGLGYAGRGAGLNNPEMEAVQGTGPLPRGRYRIGKPLDPPDHLGPMAMPLTPGPANEMFGRGDFFIHGDNAALDHTASEGCIVLPARVRAAICASGDGELEVVA